MKVTEVSPDDLKIRFSLFDLARDTGDDAVMSKMVEEFRGKMGVTSAEARYADAARTVALVRKQVRDRTPTGRQALPLEDSEKHSLASARKLLEEVSQVRANWFEVPRVLGDIDVLEGNADAAITNYQLALKLGPPNPITIRPLVLLLSRQNRTEDVKAALDLIGSDYVEQLELGRIGIENDVKLNDFSDAIDRARHEVPNDSRDPSGHIWIGSLYDRAGKPVEAEASFRRAVATGPEQPETWLRLLEHLAKSGKGGRNSRRALRSPKAIAGGPRESGSRSRLRVDRTVSAGRAILLSRVGGGARRSLDASHRCEFLHANRPRR